MGLRLSTIRQPAILAVCLVSCKGGSPSEPTAKWLELQAASPAQAPYGVPSSIDLLGENLDGVVEVYFASSEGTKRGMVEQRGSSSIRVRVPAHQWFGSARIIVSEGSQTYHQRAEMPGLLRLVGPAYPDMEIYEYRDEIGRLFRWRRERFPLRVFLSPFAEEEDRAAVIAGVQSWTDAVAPGVPSFLITADSAGADVLWLPQDFENRAACLTGHPVRTSAGVELQEWIERSVIGCWPGFYAGELIPRTNQVIAGREMGHALGILRHSKRETDIMGIPFVGVAPSVADFRTLRHLYERAE